MKILLHTCCAPCLIAPYHSLVARGYEVVAFFYNPNIQPYREFRRRLGAFREYIAANHIPAIIDENYDLEFMLRKYLDRGDAPRCRICYDVRLGETARLATQKGFDAFSTTLSVSPYQSHTIIREAGEAAARQYNIRFLYQDWRPEFYAAHEEAKSLGLYMQTYCGCIFSEEERYRPSVRRRLAKKRRKDRKLSANYANERE